MIKKNHTYKITTEEKKDLIVTPIEHTPKLVETVEQNEVPLENQFYFFANASICAYPAEKSMGSSRSFFLTASRPS